MTVRCIYMGTPDFACPALRALATMGGVSVDLVVTQPDRAVGRGRKTQSPPVKVVAEELGLSIYQTASLRTAEQREPIVAIDPDLIVVAAFGLILGNSILTLPRLGCINLHASLLPAYRGAAPISAAIANGDGQTGVTLMRMERGLDTGPMQASSSIDISDTDTTESLTARLADVAADLLRSSLAELIAGQLPAVPQGDGATLTRPLVKADGWIDWSRSAVDLERHVRAMWSWPRAWTTTDRGDALQIHQATATTDNETAASPPRIPGTIVNANGGLAVATGDGLLVIERGQLPGGKPLPGQVLAQRPELQPGQELGNEGRPEHLIPLVEPVEG